MRTFGVWMIVAATLSILWALLGIPKNDNECLCCVLTHILWVLNGIAGTLHVNRSE